MKIYHIGLNAGTNDGLEQSFRKVSEYKSINTKHPDLNTKCLSDCKAFRPDLIFIQVQSANVIQHSTLEFLKLYCNKIINFTGDVREPLPDWYIWTGRIVDLTLFVNMDDVKKAQGQINCDWIQIGFDDKIFNKNIIAAPSPEIVFMANNYGSFKLSAYRKEIVNALAKEFRGRFEVFGSGWSKARNLNSSLEAQAAIYRGCKIAINCSHFNSSMYSSDRILRIMGAGAFCLSHDFKDHNILYGDQLATFRDIPELIAKCRYYLQNEEERKRIADKGYDFTHSLFTWDKFVQNLIYYYGI